MELRELLSHLGRRLWLLVIIPVAALLLVIGLNAPSGTKYSSSVDLRATNPVGDPTVAAINLVAGSLVNATTSDEVISQVASAAGTSDKRIREGLSASRVADTELVHVTFSDTDQGVVEKAMLAIPTAVQEATFAPTIRQAEVAANEAQKAMDAATAELDAVRDETNLTMPDREYQVAASEVTSLKVALATAKGRPDTVTTKPIEDALKSAQARVKSILAAQDKFVAPQYAVDNARDELAKRTSAINDIEARQASTIAESIQKEARPLSWATETLRRGISAVLIGLALAILLLAIPEVLRRSRRGSDDEYYAPAQPSTRPVTPRSSGSTTPRSEVGV